GLADTGTVIITQDPDSAAATSLLPPTHFVLLNLDNLYPSLQAWLAKTGADAFTKPQSIVFVTGPSRTADIEMTLTIGVHGPAKVVVFGIEGD
ncbi:MAG: LUD domain-containing protein, partial [Anaerolineales bacterium]